MAGLWRLLGLLRLQLPRRLFVLLAISRWHGEDQKGVESGGEEAEEGGEGAK